MHEGFPRMHAYLVGGLIVLLAAVAVMDTESSMREAPLSAPPSLALKDAALDGSAASSPLASSAEGEIGLKALNDLKDLKEKPLPLPAAQPASAPPPAAPDWQIARVQRNDTLERVFRRNRLSPADLQCLIDSGPLGARLHEVHPGDVIEFTMDDAGRLQRLGYSPAPLERLEFERVEAGCAASRTLVAPAVETVARHGVIDHSLWLAGQRSGLDDRITIRLAQIFQWDIDFVLDIRKGDEFRLVYEERRHEGQLIGFDILAAEFVNQGSPYRAVRYVDGSGDDGYYTPAGESMRKEFLRAPVEFTRISSNFNLRRRHPLFNRSMPHRGIDYAAPVGTPVLAAGDGRVQIAGRTRPNGNYIVLRHGETFQTKYLHLTRFAKGVRVGRRVRQGEVIGYVGATGYATGPHLHYEFLVNGVHRNPRTVELPPAAPVAAQERQRFLAQTTPLLARLEGFQQGQAVAAR